MTARWYETFFDELALDIWQDSRTEELTAEEADTLDSLLAAPDGGRLLDLACGNGRHAVALASRGYAMTGMDIAEANRARASELAAAAGTSIEFETQDITRIDYDAAFDAAYMWGNSFGYFPRNASVQFFGSVARALKPGGRFVMETAVSAESILADFAPRTWVPISESMRVLLEGRYHPRESRLETIYTTIRDGQVVGESTAQVWIYTSGELAAMAESAGFEVLDMHGDLDGNPFELGDDQLILVLERTRT